MMVGRDSNKSDGSSVDERAVAEALWRKIGFYLYWKVIVYLLLSCIFHDFSKS